MFAVLVVVFGFPEVAQPPRIGFHLQNSRKQCLIFTAFVRNVCCFSIRWNNDLLCTEQSAIRTAKVPHAIVVYRRRTRGVITKVSFVNLRLPCRGERKRLIAFAHGLQSCRFARSFSALGPWQNIRVRVPKARTLRNWMRISFGCSGAQDVKCKGGRQGFSNGVFPIYRLAAVPDDDGQEHALARGGWWAVIWWWRVAGGRRLVAGGWRLVAGGVADGWWLMAGGWRLVA